MLLPFLATTAAPLAGEPASVLVYRGHEPEGNLGIDGSAAILRGRIAHGEKGFTLVSSDTILVSAPR